MVVFFTTNLQQPKNKNTPQDATLAATQHRKLPFHPLGYNLQQSRYMANQFATRNALERWHGYAGVARYMDDEMTIQ